jgi:hypothetical protein
MTMKWAEEKLAKAGLATSGKAYTIFTRLVQDLLPLEKKKCKTPIELREKFSKEGCSLTI